jgi:Zn-dependent protease with chaperone function
MTFMPNAICFGPDLPAAGAPCEVHLLSEGLSVRLGSTEPEAIPFTNMVVEAGGFEDDHVTIGWTENGTTRTLYIKDPELIRALRKSAPPAVSASLDRTARRVRSGRVRRRTLAAAILTGLPVLLLGLWIGFDAVVATAVDRIPPSWERALGEVGRQEIVTGKRVLKEGPAVTAVQEIAQRLADHIPENPYRFEIEVVQSDLVNALALPGGFVVVFTGLLKQAESPEEIAGVLAHEMSHVLLRHGLRGMVKNMGLLAVVAILVGNQDGLIGLAQRLGIQLAELRFSRDMEAAADRAGVDLLHRAAISPSGLIRFFERLAASDGEPTELLSTHPMSAARAKRLESDAASLGPQQSIPFTIDWAAVRQSLSQGAAARPPRSVHPAVVLALPFW